MCVMNGSARELVTWIKASVKSLSISPAYGSLRAALDELSESSGLSASLIHKIYDGRADNPTADTIDKLVAAIKQATRKAAA